jgi:carboxypeptidase Q
MRNILLSFACLLSGAAVAQQETVDMSMMQRIRTEENDHSQIAWIAHQLTDVMGPRLTGSPAFDRAAAWAVQTLQGWGLTAAAKESWGAFGKGWATNYAYAALKTPYYQPIIIYPRAWTPGTGGMVTGRILVLDAMDSAHVAKAGDAVKGAIILVKSNNKTLMSSFVADAKRYSADTLDRLPASDMIERGLIDFYAGYLKKENKVKQTLHEKGALAMLSGSEMGRDGTVVVDGDWLQASGKYPALLPEAVVTDEDFLRLQRLAADNSGATLDLDLRNQWYDDAQGYNVVAEIPGTDPSLKSQLVMLGGHFDSWHSATGATDNGAGSIVMMEAVRVLEALGVHPRRTIRIALWGGEEEGLLGSFGYVCKHFGDPATMQLTPEQAKVSAYYNLDNGTGKIRGIYLQHDTAAGPLFRSWLAPFADLDATGVTFSNTGSTDHLSFDAVGIPGFQFIQDPMDYETRTHHSNMDSYDHLSLPDLRQAATIVAAFVYNTAMRDPMVPRKPLPPAGKFVFDFRGLF